MISERESGTHESECRPLILHFPMLIRRKLHLSFLTAHYPGLQILVQRGVLTQASEQSMPWLDKSKESHNINVIARSACRKQLKIKPPKPVTSPTPELPIHSLSHHTRQQNTSPSGAVCCQQLLLGNDAAWASGVS